MSTSQPKPKKDEAPASETAAEPGSTEAAAPAETPAATNADSTNADSTNAASTEADSTEAASTNADSTNTDSTNAASTEAASKPEANAQAQPAAAAEQTAEPGEATAEPVWPPPESKPAESPAGKSDEPAPLTKPDEPALLTKPDEPALLTKPEEPALLTKPEEPPTAAKPAEPASEPKQEMALSESTLHWLVDGEQPIEAGEPNPTLAPIYDARAPVAGRKRTFAIIGGAAVLSLGIAWVLHAQAAHHRTVAAASADNSADLLVHRAETALAQGRAAEALDLARLAIVTDPGLANAYIIVGTVQRTGGQALDARDSYRHYLELAPIGIHAAEARAALKTLPP